MPKEQAEHFAAARDLFVMLDEVVDGFSLVDTDARIVWLNVNQRRRHLFERRHARRSVVIGRGRICPWLGTLAWSDQAATAP